MKKNSRQHSVLNFKRLARKINELITSGQWSTLGKDKQKTLTLSLAYYFQKVKAFLGKRKLARILGAACILFSVSATAQTAFGPRQENPFGTEVIEDAYIRRVAFGDLDNDGDLDLITNEYGYEGGLIYQENTGTAEAPVYSGSVENPFGIAPVAEYTFFPSLVDIDDDGDLDLFTSGYYGIVSFFENTGTPEAPAFAAPTENPFGLSPLDYNFLISTADLDDDGDVDFVFTAYDEDEGIWSIGYAENTGTAEDAAFGVPEFSPFGIELTPVTGEYVSFVDFADLDDDGDLDMIRTTIYSSSLYYHENIGTATAPAFAAGDGVINPFGIGVLDVDSYFIHPTFADIDDDGDSDLFVTGYYGETFFFENLTPGGPDCEGELTIETSGVTCPDDEDGSINISVTGGAAPFTYDIGDGAVDSGLFTDLDAGDYTVIVTDDTGCEFEEDVTVESPDEIEVVSTIVPEATGGDGEIAITTTGGTGDYTYAWSGPGGFTSADEDLTGLVGGTYTLTITDDNGCTFVTTVVVESTASINQENPVFNVYPNPSTGLITIEYNGNELTSLNVMDMTGRIIISHTQISQQSMYSIDLSNFEDGSYLLELNFDGSKQIKRIIKK